MQTSLKTDIAQIFSCCPKNLSCPKFGGAAVPLAPWARTPMSWDTGWTWVDNLETRRTRQLTTIKYKLKNHIAPHRLAQIFNGTNPMYSYNLRTQNIICLAQDCMLRLKKTASTIEGLSSGIVYPTLLKNRQAWSYFSRIRSLRTILITILI